MNLGIRSMRTAYILINLFWNGYEEFPVMFTCLIFLLCLVNSKSLIFRYIVLFNCKRGWRIMMAKTKTSAGRAAGKRRTDCCGGCRRRHDHHCRRRRCCWCCCRHRPAALRLSQRRGIDRFSVRWSVSPASQRRRRVFVIDEQKRFSAIRKKSKISAVRPRGRVTL